MTMAERLTHAAAQEIYGAAYGKATKRKAERAVGAVLRELADHIRAFPLMELDEPGPTFDGGMWNAYAQLSNTFAVTADSIEKGEG